MANNLGRSVGPYLLPASSLLGLLGVSGGVYGLLSPREFSRSIGISPASVDASALPFASFAAARNLGSGLSLLALCWYGDRRAAGVCLLAGPTTALADACICVKYGGEQSKAVGHAVMASIIATLGASLYWLD